MEKIVENAPALWIKDLPKPRPGGHKYDRGHLVVLGGSRLTGAARLASEAAMRMGSGLCTIVCAPEAAEIYRKGAPHVMVETFEDISDFPDHLSDPRRTAALLGPGAGLENKEGLKKAALGALGTSRPLLLDADALTVFADEPEKLFTALHGRCVLTPHEGEFARIFPDLAEGDRTERALKASRRSRAVILLKGEKTVIAAPDGRAILNTHASPWLATAGSGDVLAGMIGGLLAQGVDPFQAACMAVWMHGEIALQFGPGLTAPDIVDGIPDVLKEVTELL